MTTRLGWVLAATLAVPAVASAQTGAAEGFFIEVPVTLSTPLGEGEWEGTADPSFATGATIGWMFALGDWAAAIGPELSVGYTIVNVEDDDWGDGEDDDVYIGRLGVLAGARMVLGFGSAFVLARLGVGMDYAHASWDPVVYDRDEDDNDVGAAMLFGMGMGYAFTDLIALSLQLNFPVGFHDNDPGPLPVALDGTMLDFAATAAIAFRLQ